MILPMFSIKDRKTGFLTPVVEQTEASAIRNFQHAVQQGPQSLFYTHADDYVLCKIGMFDTEHGRLIPEEDIVFVAEAADLKEV